MRANAERIGGAIDRRPPADEVAGLVKAIRPEESLWDKCVNRSGFRERRMASGVVDAAEGLSDYSMHDSKWVSV